MQVLPLNHHLPCFGSLYVTDATPLAATIQWMTRDGASMISGLVFTSLMSTNFGTNIKAWRLFADGIVDVGITLEVSE